MDFQSAVTARISTTVMPSNFPTRYLLLNVDNLHHVPLFRFPCFFFLETLPERR
jgi:hypothetical protein